VKCKQLKKKENACVKVYWIDACALKVTVA